jgi:hypothetical protein
VLFLLFVALFLAPVFTELSLLGIKFKTQVKELKEEVAGLRSDIRNSIDVRTQINPVFNTLAPPPDSQLPALEGRLRAVLTEVLREYGIDRPPRALDMPSVSDDVLYLFNARFHIEKELRRILSDRTAPDERRRPVPVFQIARTLASEGLLDQRLAHVVREVYAVASPAVHGEPVSSAQVAFVRDVAPELIATLRAIGSPDGA